jgi:esterase/lipase superfamily enzyme
MEGLVDAQLAATARDAGRSTTSCSPRPTSTSTCFKTQIESCRSRSSTASSSSSRGRRALRVSRRLAGGVDRVGAADAAELGELGVTVIDLSEIEDSSSGSHSKFAGSPEVVKLIGAALNAGAEIDGGEVPAQSLLQNLPIRIFN